MREWKCTQGTKISEPYWIKVPGLQIEDLIRQKQRNAFTKGGIWY